MSVKKPGNKRPRGLRGLLLVCIVGLVATGTGCTRRSSSDNTAFKVDACAAVQRINDIDPPKPDDRSEMREYAKQADQSLKNVNWKLKIRNKKGERIEPPAEIKQHFETMHRVVTRFRGQVDEAAASGDGAAATASSKLTAAASELAASEVFLAGDRALQKFLAETCK